MLRDVGRTDNNVLELVRGLGREWDTKGVTDYRMNNTDGRLFGLVRNRRSFGPLRLYENRV